MKVPTVCYVLQYRQAPINYAISYIVMSISHDNKKT